MITEAAIIEAGRTALGIELGSTRIKACLVDLDAPAKVLASGDFEWSDRFENGLWTYSLDAVRAGLRSAYADLLTHCRRLHGVAPTTFGAMGVSAMMHGYLAFDDDGELLVPFRTWRNTNTSDAAAGLSDRFGINIPLRWSIAHLYQAMLDGESHVSRVAHLTTLAGYVHWCLTGRKVLGVGDASGMFPVAAEGNGHVESMLDSFDELAADAAMPWRIRDLLPDVLVAGQDAGTLTVEGASFLDDSGTLVAGIPLCPPEGDAGTGMVATHAIAPRTGNVSVGTSIFAMAVLERPLRKPHPEIDMVTTPSGNPVAMVHCNNGASEVAAWAGLFREFATAAGVGTDTDATFDVLFNLARQGDADAGGLLVYNNLAGEPVANLAEGRPLSMRAPGSRFTLANFMRAQLYSTFATLSIGMQILAGDGVELDRMFGHGGLFRTADVAQRFLAAALDTPVAVCDTASEGGAWGIAVLASYLVSGADRDLAGFLRDRVFASMRFEVIEPTRADVTGFSIYLDRYRKGLVVDAAAAEALP